MFDAVGATSYFDGGPGVDQLLARGISTTAGSTGTVSTTSIQFGGTTTQVKDVEVGSLLGTEFSDSLTLTGVPAAITLSLIGGGGDDLATMSYNIVNAIPPGAAFHLSGGAGSDTLTVNGRTSADDLLFEAGQLGQSSNLASIRHDGVETLNFSGRGSADWTGAGLGSTAAKNASPRNSTLGLLEASEFKSIYGASAPFSGVTIDTTAVLVKYTYYGDNDFSGIANFDDYARTDLGFSTGRTGWLNGDFDGNGQVNFDDYSLIDLAFNTQGSPLRPGVIDDRAKGGKAGSAQR